MVRNYPAKEASSAPATGRLFYEFLMRNITIPAAANHNIWYAGEEAKSAKPNEFAFRGDIPTGRALELIALAGKSFSKCSEPDGISNEPDNQPDGCGERRNYTFTGDESYVLVSDLSYNAREELSIPSTARGKDKVFNSNFKPYEELSSLTKVSNELAVLSLSKSINSYLVGIKAKINYSERDVLNLLTASFDDLSGPEMIHLLHGNHLAWAALAYTREALKGKGNVSDDILTEFYGQNPIDYYTKDLGTILPAMFFALASLGQDPVKFHQKLDIEVWGAKEAAEHMKQYMSRE